MWRSLVRAETKDQDSWHADASLGLQVRRQRGGQIDGRMSEIFGSQRNRDHRVAHRIRIDVDRFPRKPDLRRPKRDCRTENLLPQRGRGHDVGPLKFMREGACRSCRWSRCCRRRQS